MERGRIQALPKFFWVPPIISGTGKATNFNFCTHILSINRNKSLLEISGKVAGCVVRTLKTFQGTHILGASRGVLCASSAVLFFQWVLFSKMSNTQAIKILIHTLTTFCWQKHERIFKKQVTSVAHTASTESGKSCQCSSWRIPIKCPLLQLSTVTAWERLH